MIELEFHIPLPPDATWERLIKEPHLRKWWGPDVKLEPFKRGKFFEPWTDGTGQKRVTVGSVTAIETPSRLQMNFQEQDWPDATRVEFLLAPKDGGTRLHILHSGWEILSDDAQRTREVDARVKGWEELMRRFTRYCTESM